MGPIDRRKAIPFDATPTERLQLIEDRLLRGSERMDLMQDELASISKTTTEVRDLLDAGKGGLKVLGWFGNVAKWVGALASACVAIYVAIYAVTHGGELPRK